MKISEVKIGQLYSSSYGYFLAITPHLNNKSEVYSCEGLFYDSSDQRMVKGYMDNVSEYQIAKSKYFRYKKELIEYIFIYEW